MTRDIESDPQRKRRRLWARLWLWLTTVMLLILMPFLGFRGSLLYQSSNARGRWQRLEPMPTRGVAIVTGTLSEVYVRTAKGSIYGCRHRRDTNGPESCWFEVQEPLDLNRDALLDPRAGQREVKPPAGTVVDTLEVAVWYYEGVSRTHYVLMQDGTVFKWEHSVHAMVDAIRPMGWAAVGLVLGIVAVVVLWRIRWVKPTGLPQAQ